MENCWFVLKQTHYPAPDADSMRKGKPTGPISLGHIIRDLKHLDQVINAESIEPFTRAMQIWQTRMVDFKWSQAEEQATAVEAGVAIPIVAAAGLTVGAHAGFAFRQSVKNYWEFGHLDRYIVQPTSSYVNDCLETEEVAQYVEEVQKLGHWSFFMITGLIVARGGGKNTTTEASSHEVSAGVDVSFPTLLEVGPEATVSDSKESSLKVTHTTDFVWALRLAKISKGGLQRNWSMKTVFGRESFFGQSALFSEEREKIDIEAVVTAEGSRSDKFRVVQDDSLDSAFILFGPNVAGSN